MSESENQKTRIPMNRNELNDLLSYMKESFLKGDTDQEIVEDLFGSYVTWREDLIALIRMLVERMALTSGTQVHIDTDHPEWGRVASDGIILEVFSDGKYLVNVQSIRADIIVNEEDIALK